MLVSHVLLRHVVRGARTILRILQKWVHTYILYPVLYSTILQWMDEDFRLYKPNGCMNDRGNLF